MQNYKNLKRFMLLFGLLLPIAWCGAATLVLKDGYSAIQVKVAQVQSMPKNSSINASIYGHTLTVVFTENLGEVAVDITSVTGGYVQADSCLTPNGLMFYIPNAGDYIVTFTLPNGDEYYGEFSVTD